MGRNARNRITGQEQAEVKEAIMIPAACPTCRSMRRTKMEATVSIESSGVTADGQPYTKVTWRRCSCLDCGQHYTVRSYENYPQPERATENEPQTDSQPNSQSEVEPSQSAE